MRLPAWCLSDEGCRAVGCGRSADQWKALCGLAPELAGIVELDASLTDRLARRVQLDTALGIWRPTGEALEASLELRVAGVPADVPLCSTDFHTAPQLEARKFFVDLDHSEIGRMLFDVPVTTISDTPYAPKGRLL